MLFLPPPFFFGHVAYAILVPKPGMEPTAPFIGSVVS